MSVTAQLCAVQVHPSPLLNALLPPPPHVLPRPAACKQCCKVHSVLPPSVLGRKPHREPAVTSQQWMRTGSPVSFCPFKKVPSLNDSLHVFCCGLMSCFDQRAFAILSGLVLLVTVM